MRVFLIEIQQKVGAASACCRGESLLGARYHFFKNTGIRIVGSSLRKLFVASVCEQTLLQACRCGFGGKLFYQQVGVKRHDIIQRNDIPDGSSDVKMIVSLFQYVGGFENFSQIIVGSHGILCCLERQKLAFAREERSCLAKSGEFARRFLQKSLRRTVIHLHDFFSAVISGICDKDKSADGLLGFGHTLHRKGKLCVGKSESERIAYAFCRIPKSLKIAVAHIDILSIVHVVNRFVEICGGRIVVHRSGEGVRKLAGRGYLSTQQFRHGKSALHAALPCDERGGDLIVIFDPGGIDDAADI